jgi:hypothetical protein
MSWFSPLPVRLFGLLALVAFSPELSSAPIVATPYSYNVTLDAGSPVFWRTREGNPPDSLSGAGTAMSYNALAFVPDTTGSYTFETTAAALSRGPNGERADDTFLALYQGLFNPGSALVNILQADDDSGPDSLSLFSRSLTSGVNYILVTTTFTDRQYGSITTRISGPQGSSLDLGTGSSVPEPGTITLVAGALLALQVVRRRKAK